jgi:hypothetical protein
MIYLIGASVAGWIQPVWWGGDALLAPIISGGVLILIGTIPFFWIARRVAVVFLGIPPIPGSIFLVGIIIGISLMPIADLLGFTLRTIPKWQLITPWIAVALVMAIAGLIGTLLGAILVSISSRRKIDKVSPIS